MEVSRITVKTGQEEEEEDSNELSLELSIGRKCYDNKTSTTRRQNGNVCCVINHHDVLLVDEEYDEEEGAEMPPRKKEKCLNNVGHKKQEKLGLMGDSPCPYPLLPAIQYVPFTNGFVYNPMPSSLASSLVACTNGLLMDKDKRVGIEGLDKDKRFGIEGLDKDKRFGIEGLDKDKRVGIEGLDKDKRVSFDSRSFRPCSSSRNIIELSVVNGRSDASSGGSSPAVSDHHNSSLQGGSSSISLPRESQNASSAGNGPKRSEIKSWDSVGLGSNEVKVKTKSNHIVNTTSLTNIQVRESRCSEEKKPAATLEDPTLGTKNPIDPALLKKKTSNAVITNPPKTQLERNGASSLPQMPCVSTTGNGPNGKTITGFLYRYTKTEVCIVCVCHGTSFSPAEFVKHAGGVDVEHPLRHITIVPSDLT